MTYIKTSIPKLPGSGATTPKGDRIYIYDVTDVSADVVRVFGQTSVSGSLTLERGAKGISIQVSRASISAGYENTGEVGAKVFSDKVEFEYPGDTVALNNFIEAFAHKGVILIVTGCEGPAKIYGRVCNPMYLSAEPTDSNEGVRTRLSFSQEMGDAFIPRRYEGVLPDVAEDEGARYFWLRTSVWEDAKTWYVE